MSKHHRKPLVFGFVSAVAVMTLASTAFACTFFRGTMKAQGNATTDVVTVIGNNTGMGYCGNTISGFAKATKSSGVVAILLQPASTCLDGNGVNRLPRDTYSVDFINGAAYTTDSSGKTTMKLDCMTPGGDTGTTNIGSIAVDSSGFSLKTDGTRGARAYALPSGLTANGPSDESAVCVSDSTATDGHQAPIVIV